MARRRPMAASAGLAPRDTGERGWPGGGEVLLTAGDLLAYRRWRRSLEWPIRLTGAYWAVARGEQATGGAELKIGDLRRNGAFDGAPVGDGCGA